MANFYLDNSDLKHHLNHPLMKRLVALKERNYTGLNMLPEQKKIWTPL